MNKILENQDTVSIFGTAACNLNCSYCYIHKIKESKLIHANIINGIDNGDIVESIKKLYNTNIKQLTIWGGEPTLSIDAITNKIDNWKETFPKLKEISFSTNFTTDINKIVKLIQKLSDNNISLDLQISFDGPELTAMNRGKNTEKMVIDNLFKLIELLNNIELTVPFKIYDKSTLCASNFDHLLKDNNIFNHWNFYDKLSKDINTLNTNKNVIIHISGVANIAGPLLNTKNEGILYNEIVKQTFELKDSFDNIHPDSFISSTIRRLLSYGEDIFNKRHMFTCSGGSYCYGISSDDLLHCCHDSYFLSSDHYLDYVRSVDYDQYIYMKNARKQMSSSLNNKLDSIRLMYLLSGFHNYSKLQLSHTQTMVNELIACNQIDGIYANKKMFDILSLFLLVYSCFFNNIKTTGSIHIHSIGSIKIICNGALESVLKELKISV